MAYTIQNFTGFESGDLTETSADTPYGLSDYGTITTTSGTHREYGSYALQVPINATEGVCYCVFGPPTLNTVTTAVVPATYGGAGVSVYQSFYFQYTMDTWGSSAEPICDWLKYSASNPVLYLNTDGTLTLKDRTGTSMGTSSTALAEGTWYRIDVAFKSGAGNDYELRINGLTEISADGAGEANTFFYGIRLGRISVGDSTAEGAFLYDDVVNLTGDWMPTDDYFVSTRIPDAVSEGSWHTSSGTETSCVDEVPHDGDTTTIWGELGDSDPILFSGSLVETFTQVLGVKAHFAGKKKVTHQFRAVMKYDGVTSGPPNLGNFLNSTTIYAGAGFIRQEDFSVDPTIPWTSDSANAITWGPNLAYIYVTNTQLHVLHGVKVSGSIPYNFGG